MKLEPGGPHDDWGALHKGITAPVVRSLLGQLPGLTPLGGSTVTTRPSSVCAEFSLRLLLPATAPVTVRAGLRYDENDPYAVEVSFHTGTGGGSEVVQWTFARSLLSDGVTGPAGEGDVQVWPSTPEGQNVVCLSLSSPSGRALFEMPVADLVEFLARTYESVPTGAESSMVDVDAELALLLWAEPGA